MLSKKFLLKNIALFLACALLLTGCGGSLFSGDTSIVLPKQEKLLPTSAYANSLGTKLSKYDGGDLSAFNIDDSYQAVLFFDCLDFTYIPAVGKAPASGVFTYMYQSLNWRVNVVKDDYDEDIIGESVDEILDRNKTEDGLASVGEYEADASDAYAQEEMGIANVYTNAQMTDEEIDALVEAVKHKQVEKYGPQEMLTVFAQYNYITEEYTEIFRLATAPNPEKSAFLQYTPDRDGYFFYFGGTAYIYDLSGKETYAFDISGVFRELESTPGVAQVTLSNIILSRNDLANASTKLNPVAYIDVYTVMERRVIDESYELPEEEYEEGGAEEYQETVADASVVHRKTRITITSLNLKNTSSKKAQLLYNKSSGILEYNLSENNAHYQLRWAIPSALAEKMLSSGTLALSNPINNHITGNTKYSKSTFIFNLATPGKSTGGEIYDYSYFFKNVVVGRKQPDYAWSITPYWYRYKKKTYFRTTSFIDATGALSNEIYSFTAGNNSSNEAWLISTGSWNIVNSTEAEVYHLSDKIFSLMWDYTETLTEQIEIPLTAGGRLVQSDSWIYASVGKGGYAFSANSSSTISASGAAEMTASAAAALKTDYIVLVNEDVVTYYYSQNQLVSIGKTQLDPSSGPASGTSDGQSYAQASPNIIEAGNVLVIGERDVLVTTLYGGVYRSTENGAKGQILDLALYRSWEMAGDGQFIAIGFDAGDESLSGKHFDYTDYAYAKVFTYFLPGTEAESQYVQAQLEKAQREQLEQEEKALMQGFTRELATSTYPVIYNQYKALYSNALLGEDSEGAARYKRSLELLDMAYAQDKQNIDARLLGEKTAMLTGKSEQDYLVIREEYKRLRDLAEVNSEAGLHAYYENEIALLNAAYNAVYAEGLTAEEAESASHEGDDEKLRQEEAEENEAAAEEMVSDEVDFSEVMTEEQLQGAIVTMRAWAGLSDTAEEDFQALLYDYIETMNTAEGGGYRNYASQTRALIGAMEEARVAAFKGAVLGGMDEAYYAQIGEALDGVIAGAVRRGLADYAARLEALRAEIEALGSAARQEETLPEGEAPNEEAEENTLPE